MPNNGRRKAAAEPIKPTSAEVCKECGAGNVTPHAEDCSIGAQVVDGQAAKIDKTARPKAHESEAVTVPPIELLDGAWEALQRRYDAGDFSGGKQVQKKCEFEYAIEGAKTTCDFVAVIEQKITIECEYGKHKKHLAGFCLGHAINVLGGNAPAKLQMELIPK